MEWGADVMSSLKRAIILAGGGPAVGLSLGALKRLEREADIAFDVWSCACIGAWVGVLWNQAPVGQGAAAAEAFFRDVFRPDQDYARFPMASIFAPNWGDYAVSAAKFVADPASYRDLVAPDMIRRAMFDQTRRAMTPASWSEGEMNAALFNNFIAPNPLARFATSMVYQSTLNGLAQVYYPNRAFLETMDFDALYGADRPALYFNAFNASRAETALFSNRRGDGYRDIDAQALCASSALPYLLSPIERDGDVYMEGATVETVGFANILDDHSDLDEIWISRLLDLKQARPPETLVDALNSLVMLFAAANSAKDVTLFRAQVDAAKAAGRVKSTLRIVDIPVSATVRYDWSHANLDLGIAEGYAACDTALKDYRVGSGLRAAA